MATSEEFSRPLSSAFQAHVSNDKKYVFNTNFQIPAWLNVRLFYVRMSSSPSGEVPEKLMLRYPPRGINTALEVRGARISPSEAAVIPLRKDRVGSDSTDVTYVSTAKFRTSGTISFEVFHKRKMILRGSLKRSQPTMEPLHPHDSNNCTSNLEMSVNAGWRMECSCAVGSQGCIFLKGRHDLFTAWRSSMEVCVAGRYSALPVILTQTVQLTSSRRALRHGMLDVIPEGDEIGKIQQERSMALLPAREIRDMPIYSDSIAVAGFEKYNMDNGEYAEKEDEDLSWVNAGVRLGLGVGLGMCLGVGIGLGLMVRAYQSTTKSLKRGFF